MTIRLNILRLFILVALGMALPGFAEQPGEASQVIVTLNSALLDTMKKAKALGYHQRYKKLSKVIDSTHDLEYIARFSIGRKNWEQLGDEKRKKFVDGFREYSIAAYSSRFNGFSGEVFRVTGEQPGKRGRIQVDSVLEIPGEETVDFVYLLRLDEGKLKIVNILVEGVSDLALKRAEFKSLLADKGFDALMAHLAEQSGEYATATD